MNPDKLNALKELISVALQLVVAVTGSISLLRGMYLMRLRARERMAVIQRGGDPSSLPEIGQNPLLFFVIGGVVLAYLLAQHPELARLPVLKADELALRAAVKYCDSSKECGEGETCDRGQCVYPKESKPQTDRRRPRVVADVQGGTLCADCPNAPWMLSAIAAPQ